MTVIGSRLPAPAAALRAMVPGVRISSGYDDEYLPGNWTVRLSYETQMGRDFPSVLRALHEGGHAVQHRRQTRLWRYRVANPAFRTAWALSWLLSFCAFYAEPLAGWAFFAVGCLVTVANGVLIVANEREASEFAVGWLSREVGLTPSEQTDARRYLAGLRRGYWRTIFGL